MTATKTTAAPDTFDPATQRTINKVDPQQVHKGHLMAFVYYATVDSVRPSDPGKGNDQIVCTGLDGQGQFGVHGTNLIGNAFSADYFATEERVSKTRAAEILISSYNRPFTVKFQKQPKKGQTVGEMRVLRGRLIAAEPLLGRSHVEDLDEASNRMRQVDHRTIEYIIVDGVKYNVK